MAYLIRAAFVAGVICMAGCSHSTAQHLSAAELPCGDRATEIIAQNVTSITQHRYHDASDVAERAARASFACAASENFTPQAFSDKWRGANELVVAAELAHQGADETRAHRLLQEGYAIMHALRPPRNASPLTSSLIADKLDAARRDMHGQWAYW